MTDELPELHVIACFPLSQYPHGHPQLPASIATCIECDTRVWVPQAVWKLLERDRRQQLMCTECVARLALAQECERVEFRHMEP